MTMKSDGIVIVNKEAGFTSFDVVAKLRGILHIKKIGHTGTLDPMATGVLPVCVGKATKICDVLTDRDKTYEAEVVLGITTDTLDTTGKVLTEQPVSVTKDRLEAVLSSFRGEVTQIPPMYSAVKVNGKKLYEYAREGVEIERKKRKVTIHSLDLLSTDFQASDDAGKASAFRPSFRIRVHCSKGTYIRTLCDDIGHELGCGAAMDSLIRTEVGKFTIDRALSLSEIEELVGKNEEILMPIDSVFDGYPGFIVREDAMKLLANGNPLGLNKLQRMDDKREALHDGMIVRVYGTDGAFYALYRFDESGRRYSMEKNFK